MKTLEKTIRTDDATRSTRMRESVDRVIRELDAYCDDRAPGAKMPSDTELMTAFGASARAVRYALEDLQRRGRIVRRQRAGTFINDLRIEDVTRGASERGVRYVVVIASPDHSFFDHCVESMYARAKSLGLAIVTQVVGPALEEDFKPILAYPEGFLVCGYYLHPIAERLQAEGARVVLLGTPTEDGGCAVPVIHGDHEEGGYLAAKHLLDLGHRRIVYQEGHVERRHEGHMRAIQEYREMGHDVTSVTAASLRDVDFSDPASLAEYFHTDGAATAVTAWNDMTAKRLLHYLSRAGLRVPQDVSVVGYDNLPDSQFTVPALTTVESGTNRLLDAALKLITSRPEQTTISTTIALPILIARNSTARAMG